MAAKQVTLSIDGQRVISPAGSTLLDAARLAGARIPTLCHHDRLPPGEACRLCVVEVIGQPRPVAACAFQVKEGLEVHTLTRELDAERQAILRLILADHYGDCIAPCSLRCSANIDIQGYIALIARGRYVEATQLIRRSNPLPLTCGRVCPHPCESQCRRGRVDEPININHLKRFASDIAYRDLDQLNPAPAPATEKAIAIVGGGPAGLSAAYYLALKGHLPVIYEANPQLGGMLRYGIPEYRLPKKILDREIEAILRMGVEARNGQVWGRDFTLSDLRRSYDAVLLATGAAVNRELDFLPDGMPGVNYGTCFLGQVALGQDTGLHGKVGVIGGGNTAMDCARTAVRLGAEQVTILYRRSRKEMPAQEIEVIEAEEEGIGLELCVAPVGMREENGRLAGLTFVRMDLCEIDASGRARPKPMEGSEFDVPLDYVIVAVGQVVDEETLGKDPLAAELERTKWRTIKGDYLSGATSQEGVFAAGDLTTGPATVVEAIGGARRAAEAMDRWLRGGQHAPPRPFIFTKGTLQEADQQNFARQAPAARAGMPVLEPGDRKTNFDQVELGFSEEQALAEAKRCLACGCQAVDECLLRQAAQDMGINELVAQTEPVQPWSIRDDHPLVLIEDGKCILCRRCERACAAYHGRDAIRVNLAPLDDLAAVRSHRIEINGNCNQCGLCVQVCPTGALAYNSAWPQPGPFALEWRTSLCNLCPLHCRLKTGCLENHLVRIDGLDAAPAHGHLCHRGRVELIDAAQGDLRISKPLLRKGPELAEVGWQESLSELGIALGRMKIAAGEAGLAGLSLGRSSLEEMYLFGKLVRLGLMTNNLDFMALDQEEPQSGRLLAELAPRKGRLKYPELESYDLVVLIGQELSQRMPLLEAALHRMLARGGSLILYGRDRTLSPRAGLQHDTSPEQALQDVLRLLKDKSGEAEAADLFQAAGRIMILASEADLDQSSLLPLYRLSDLAASIPDRANLALLPAAPSVLGLRRAGVSPDHYPGHRQRTPQSMAAMRRAWQRDLPQKPGVGAKEILQKCLTGDIKGLVVQAGGLLPGEPVANSLLNAMQAVEFGVVLASNRGPLTQMARLVLPTPLCLESGGTFAGADGGRLEISPALQPPPGVHPGWRLLGLMLEVLDGPPAPRELLDVQSEMIVVNQVFAEMSHV
jgi:formate dehydrogenase major subunit